MPSTFSIRRVSNLDEYSAAVEALDTLLALRDPRVIGEVERLDAVICAFESNRSLRAHMNTTN